MPKALEVLWTERSLRNARSIRSYLKTTFSEKEVSKFDRLLKDFETNVSRFPLLYVRSNKYPELRKAIIHRYTSAFYRLESDHIVVIAIQDNRQEKPSN